MIASRPLVALLAAVALALTPAAPLASAAPPRVLAIGDVHGNADGFVAILQASGLLDAEGRWSGGRAVLVQTGDYVDRGLQVPEVLDLLMRLESEAASAGGRAIALMGNHEAMNVMGDLRDVAPELFARFADGRSQERREKAFAAHVNLAADRRTRLERAGLEGPTPEVYQEPSRDAWMAAHPPGYIEYVEAFGPSGRYGRWLRKRDAVVRVGDTIFLHGGLNPEAARKVDATNDQVRREISRWDRMRKHLIDRRAILPHFGFAEVIAAARLELDRVVAEARATRGGDPASLQAALAGNPLLELPDLGKWSVLDTNGPLWFRGFATWTAEEGGPLVDDLQRRYGKEVRFVVGHTIPSAKQITARFDSRVFLIDTGMLSTHYTGGRPSALEIADGRYTAIYQDGQTVLVNPVPRSQ